MGFTYCPREEEEWENSSLRDFRDLNNACPKEEFPLLIPELMIDATIGYEAMSFMDGSSGYNQIRMSPKDAELTAFRTLKRHLLLQSNVFWFEKCRRNIPKSYAEHL